jgi:hypothetical protein
MVSCDLNECLQCAPPKAASHQGILSVSFREIPWLLKKIHQPLEFAAVTRSNLSRTDTQKWLASGSNVPEMGPRNIEVRGRNGLLQMINER